MSQLFRFSDVLLADLAVPVEQCADCFGSVLGAGDSLRANFLRFVCNETLNGCVRICLEVVDTRLECLELISSASQRSDVFFQDSQKIPRK